MACHKGPLCHLSPWGRYCGTSLPSCRSLLLVHALMSRGGQYALEYTRAVTGCPNDWSSYRIKIGTQCVTISGSQLIWQPCASDKFTPSQNFFIQNGGDASLPQSMPLEWMLRNQFVSMLLVLSTSTCQRYRIWTLCWNWQGS